MKIEPINLELSDNLKHFLNWQEYARTKLDEGVLGVPVQYFGDKK